MQRYEKGPSAQLWKDDELGVVQDRYDIDGHFYQLEYLELSERTGTEQKIETKSREVSS